MCMEKGKNGLYKNRLTCGRCVCCFSGALLVVCLGFAAALMAFYLPALFTHQGDDAIYIRMANKLGTKSNIIELDAAECTNFLSINDSWTGRQVFQCEDKGCVPAYERCSGYSVCEDESDEADCEEFCELGVKLGVRFKCNDKQKTPQTLFPGPEFPECFHHLYKCDGAVDCPDDTLTDEDSCPSDSIVFNVGNGTKQNCSPKNNFICADLLYCTPTSAKCNEFDDCQDGSDEAGCDSEES